MAGAAHLPMLVQSLRSLAVAWSRVPPLRVVGDGTVGAASLEEAFADWPAPIEVVPRDVVVDSARSAGSADLAAFAAVSPFGLKFAALVASAVERPTLFADADVLWFRDWSGEIVALARAAGVVLRVSADYQPAYDVDVAGTSADTLATPPFVNSGVTFLHGALLDAVDLRPALAVAARRYSHFAEQTVLALAARRLGTPPWPPSVVACFQHDHQSLGITYRGRAWIARHYVGPVRHLFWRDAFALRVGVAP
jgi:hypothetical protein